MLSQQIETLLPCEATDNAMKNAVTFIKAEPLFEGPFVGDALVEGLVGVGLGDVLVGLRIPHVRVDAIDDSTQR